MTKHRQSDPDLPAGAVKHTPGRRLVAGDLIAPRVLATMTGGTVAVPDADRLIHLQLRRYAGCPVCNLHLRSIAGRRDEIIAAGVHEVVVFHSTGADLLIYEADLPFAVVADPKKKLYAEFGVETSPRAALDPRALLPMLRGIAHDVWAFARRRRKAPVVKPLGGHFGLPADLLIAPDGRVVAVKYGEYSYDQWSVDELLAHVAAHRAGG